jgi:hypothetical protein
VLFGLNPAGADGRLAALADDRKHDLADPAEILRELAQAAGRLPQSLGERAEDPRHGLAQADAALAVRRPLATGDYSTAGGADADAVTRPEIPLRLSNGQVPPTECDEQSVAVGCNPRITPNRSAYLSRRLSMLVPRRSSIPLWL